jgi:hypothetical protein
MDFKSVPKYLGDALARTRDHPRTLYRSTYYYDCQGVAYSAVAAVNNTNRAMPFFVFGDPGTTVTFDRIALEVTVVSSPTSATYRLSIYNDDGTGYPGTLVTDAGTVTVGTVGVREITFGSAQVLQAGTLYWLVASLTGATTTAPTMRFISGAQGTFPFGADVATTINKTHWAAANAGSNTATTPFPAGATPANGPRIMLRKS